ncbi:CvfB family protein [Anaerolentibacter hominis]|uniref:CvfB family protein n=1 Tax=Anaerolentibacter hominis TaxID=3079009 RepID=UPI0031B84773
MFELGITQTLAVDKFTPQGAYLKESETASEERVLLPAKQLPQDCKAGDLISVFLYKDSEDRLIATTAVPPLELGQTALLKVTDVTKIGAFLDWGLAKDLFLPFKEQSYRVSAGDEVLVSLYIDKSSRLCATMNVYEALRTDAPYQTGDQVTGLVYAVIDAFGAYVAVDNRYSALIPKKELFTRLIPGTKIQARVTKVLEDGRLNLSLREKAYLQLDTDAELVYQKLVEAGGSLPFHDKSDAGEIKDYFHLSKNAFKRALGHLMKEGRILLDDTHFECKK